MGIKNFIFLIGLPDWSRPSGIHYFRVFGIGSDLVRVWGALLETEKIDVLGSVRFTDMCYKADRKPIVLQVPLPEVYFLPLPTTFPQARHGLHG